MIIYIDENMSPYLARGFNILQAPLNLKLKETIDVRSIKDDFGQGAQDEEWIPLAGEKGACIITQDYNIKRIKHQLALCEKYSLGMFYFRPPSKNGFSYWDMLVLLVKHWLVINKISIMEKRPFAYKITSRGELEELK
jgi:predicted nuclease of predicted toxin-antitoxin system